MKYGPWPILGHPPLVKAKGVTPGGEVVSRVAHNHEIAGAIPAPATQEAKRAIFR